jgi:predicted HicB family RNase H-like nuclease
MGVCWWLRYKYMDTPQVIQTTVRLPEDLHEIAKIQAIKRKITLNDLFVLAIQASLNSQDK